MSHVFGFSEAEVKLLLVAVRQTRRNFATALQKTPNENLAAYAKLYDNLYDKLVDMAGPLPETLGDLL